MRHRLTLMLLMLLVSAATAQAVVINEFMADNETTASDQDGEFDDWIELYNTSDVAVDLSGFWLSDDPAEPLQWMFPEAIVPAGGFLIVWADSDEEQSGLHTNFKLSSDGESVVFSDASGTLIDQINFSVQSEDISYGRYPDGTGAFQLMYPTFSEANTPGIPEETVPGEEIFDTYAVHTIELEFYIDDWSDSLRYNYEDLDEEYMPVKMTFDGDVTMDSVGIRYKGNSTYRMSQGTPKKPLKLKFSKYIDGGRLYQMKTINLHNGASDPTFMREAIAYGIARRYVPAPRTSYANVYVNGELLGFYSVVEQVDETFLAGYFEDNSFNLYKSGDDGAPLIYYGDDQAVYELEYELKTNEDENNWSNFISMIDLLNNTSDEVFVDVVGQVLDFDSVLRLLAYNMVLSNFDSYTGSARNYYLYDNETTGQFTMLPWDVNETFGVYSQGWDVIDQDVMDIDNLDQRPLNRRLIENATLQLIYFDYIDEIMNGAAAPDSVVAWVETLGPIIESHVLADPYKLFSDAQYYANLHNDVYIDGGRLVPGLTSFIAARHENLVTQLSAEFVYPGDTNNDGFVDEYDILPIAVYFMTEGQTRSGASNQWQAQRCFQWQEHAAMFADANGDGIVDEKDVVVLGVNWGQSHDAATTQFVLDLDDPEVAAASREVFEQLNSSLAGNGAAVTRIKSLLSSVLDSETTLPVQFTLEQNFPNPFNQSTTVRFTLPRESAVTFTLINILGQTVMQPLHKTPLSAGEHTMSLDASGLPSGVYFYRVQTSTDSRTRKLVLSK